MLYFYKYSGCLFFTARIIAIATNFRYTQLCCWVTPYILYTVSGVTSVYFIKCIASRIASAGRYRCGRLAFIVRHCKPCLPQGPCRCSGINPFASASAQHVLATTKLYAAAKWLALAVPVPFATKRMPLWSACPQCPRRVGTGGAGKLLPWRSSGSQLMPGTARASS